MDDEQLKSLAEALARIATRDGEGAVGMYALRALQAVVPTAHRCCEWDWLVILPWGEEYKVCRCFRERATTTGGSRSSG